MRKLMCLMLLLSGLSVGCSDDDDKGSAPDDGSADGSNDDDIVEGTDPSNPSDDGTDDGSDDGVTGPDDGSDGEIPTDPSTGGGTADPNKYPECPKEMIPAEFDPYTGEKPFSQTDLAACQQTCAGKNPATCLTDENCPGVEAFNECISTGTINCSAKQGGECRVAYENFICCASFSGCGQDDFACVQQACPDDIALVQTCLQNDSVCNEDESILAECLGSDEVGGGDGTESDAGADGTDSDAGVDTGDEAIGGGVSNGDGANFSRAFDGFQSRALLRQISAR